MVGLAEMYLMEGVGCVAEVCWSEYFTSIALVSIVFWCVVIRATDINWAQHPVSPHFEYLHPPTPIDNTMGLFTRRERPIDANTTTATGTHHTPNSPSGRRGIMSRHEKHPRSSNTHHTSGGAWNSRPTFGIWLKQTWLDILTMVIMGAIGLGVYMADPAPSRSFPVDFYDGEVVYPEFAYPLRNEIIPIWAAALMAALIPITVFLIMQIRVRSFWDVNNAVSPAPSLQSSGLQR